MPGLVRSFANQLRVAKRLAPRRGATLRERVGRRDDRLVFVVGSPRSGTTFLAGAIGAVPGFVDLGEVAPVKAAIPALVGLPTSDAAGRLRGILGTARRVGLVGSVRAVEQTPEMAHLVDAAVAAYPQARVVHIVRDGRDVVCSLLEKGWLGTSHDGATDDAGLAYGIEPRFWVEPERREEFTRVSDARRAAWAWRRYVTAARSATTAPFELRYETMAKTRRRPPPSWPSTSTLRLEPLALGVARGAHELDRPLPHRPHRGAARRRRRRGRRPPCRLGYLP